MYLVGILIFIIQVLVIGILKVVSINTLILITIFLKYPWPPYYHHNQLSNYHVIVILSKKKISNSKITRSNLILNMYYLIESVLNKIEDGKFVI